MPDGGDKVKALSALQYAAEQGHVAAQWKVGRMYAAGDGVPRDDQRAFAYFSQIANTHPDETPGTAQARFVANAFVALGHYYLTGIPNSVVADTGRAKEMLSRIVPAKRNGSWGTTPSCRRSECSETSFRSNPSIRTRPAVGS